MSNYHVIKNEVRRGEMNKLSKVAVLLFSFFIILSTCTADNKIIQTIDKSEKNSNGLTILFVMNIFPYPIHEYLVNQIKALLDAGHDVYVYANYGKGAVSSILAPYKFQSKVFHGKLPDNLPSFDIICCHSDRALIKGVWLKETYGLTGKLFVTLRGGETPTVSSRYPDCYNAYAKKVDLWLPVCDYFGQQLKELGCPPESIVTLPSMINADNFSYKARSPAADGTINVLSVCRVCSMKGLEDAIYAVAQVAKKYPQLRYTIIGEGGSYQKRLECYAAELGCLDKVIFLGQKKQSEIPHLLLQEHLFILPSVTTPGGVQEGIPNALKEAMCTGMPVLSTFHAGISELVEHGISGFLVAEHDREALANYLWYLVQHPEVWPSMGSRGREKILHNFDCATVTKILLSIYERYQPCDSC